MLSNWLVPAVGFVIDLLMAAALLGQHATLWQAGISYRNRGRLRAGPSPSPIEERDGQPPVGHAGRRTLGVDQQSGSVDGRPIHRRRAGRGVPGGPIRGWRLDAVCVVGGGVRDCLFGWDHQVQVATIIEPVRRQPGPTSVSKRIPEIQ